MTRFPDREETPMATPRLIRLLIVLVVLGNVGPFVATADAQTPDGRTPAEETVCNAARLSGAPADTCGFGFARGFPYFRARVPFLVRRHRAVLLAPGETLRIVLYRNDL